MKYVRGYLHVVSRGIPRHPARSRVGSHGIHNTATSRDILRDPTWNVIRSPGTPRGMRGGGGGAPGVPPLLLVTVTRPISSTIGLGELNMFSTQG